MPEGQWEYTDSRKEYESKSGVIGRRDMPPSNMPESTKWWNHMPAKSIKKIVGDNIWNEYYKFCTIRNPFDKAVSAFYWSRNSNPDEYITRAKRKFSRFLREKSKTFLRWEFERWLRGGGIDVLIDRDKYVIDGEICVDSFIKFESLIEDVENVCDNLGIKRSVNLPHLKGGTRNRKYTTADHYSNESFKMVKRKFEYEIERFGYSML
jgi:hypothetical protein